MPTSSTPSKPSQPESAAAPVAAPVDPDTNYAWHGYLLADRTDLPAPTCVCRSDTLARPNYTKVTSAEYADSAEVLDVKADLLIKMWSAAKFPLVYAGAGISTSSGVCDYASRGETSTVQAAKHPMTWSYLQGLQPTPAHRVITAMERRGMVWGWLQQNHDGLAQKAGFPADKVNELHGSWMDNKKNPIIAMSGELRGDLFEWCLQMEAKCDFVFTVGTSLSGLNADRLFHTASKRQRKGKGQGAALITIQKTPHDSAAALRIFSRIDDFMLIVAKKLAIKLDKKVYEYAAAKLPVGAPNDDAWLAERTAKRAAAAEEMTARAEAKAAKSAAAAATTETAATKMPSVAEQKEKKPLAASVGRVAAVAAATNSGSRG